MTLAFRSVTTPTDQPTNQSFGVCKVNLATLKVALNGEHHPQAVAVWPTRGERPPHIRPGELPTATCARGTLEGKVCLVHAYLVCALCVDPGTRTRRACAAVLCLACGATHQFINIHSTIHSQPLVRVSQRIRVGAHRNVLSVLRTFVIVRSWCACVCAVVYVDAHLFSRVGAECRCHAAEPLQVVCTRAVQLADTSPRQGSGVDRRKKLREEVCCCGHMRGCMCFPSHLRCAALRCVAFRTVHVTLTSTGAREREATCRCAQERADSGTYVRACALSVCVRACAVVHVDAHLFRESGLSVAAHSQGAAELLPTARVSFSTAQVATYTLSTHRHTQSPSSRVGLAADPRAPSPEEVFVSSSSSELRKKKNSAARV